MLQAWRSSGKFAGLRFCLLSLFVPCFQSAHYMHQYELVGVGLRFDKLFRAENCFRDYWGFPRLITKGAHGCSTCCMQTWSLNFDTRVIAAVSLHHVHYHSMITETLYAIQQTQKIGITFIQCWANVEDVGPTLYKCYSDALCLMGYNNNNCCKLIFKNKKANAYLTLRASRRINAPCDIF